MSQQQPLAACSQRLSGEDYIGQATAHFDPSMLIRGHTPLYIGYKRPHLTFVRDSDIETAETTSPDEENRGPRQSGPSTKPLEYRITGVTWHTKDFVNTCNLDSFLSAWVRKSRQTHGNFLRYVETMDKVGVALIKIADHALTAKEKVDSHVVKKIWMKTILQNSAESRKILFPPMDCLGNSTYSVYQHLEHHCSIEVVSSCKCGILYHRENVLEVPDLTQLGYMVNPQEIHKTGMPICLNCNEERTLRELNPKPRNWLLVFNYNGNGPTQSPDLDDVPKLVTFGGIRFKLEFLAYMECMPWGGYHEVSLQYIRGEWYVYDGASSPRFRAWNKKKYTNFNAYLCTIVYFKI